MIHRKWNRIALFYGIALALSALARLYWRIGDAAVHDGSGMYRHLIAGAGPALGAATVWLVWRYRSWISPGDTNLPLALVMIAVPAVVMGVIGVPNGGGVKSHLSGVQMGVWIAAYALLEELGWRGYLQDEFRNYRALPKYAIVGLFWYAWHLSWLNHNPLASEALTLLFVILASIGIGFAADRTGSVLAAAAFHIVGNILWLTTDFRVVMPVLHDRMVVAGLCVAVWLILLRIWRIQDIRRGTVHRVSATAN